MPTSLLIRSSPTGSLHIACNWCNLFHCKQKIIWDGKPCKNFNLLWSVYLHKDRNHVCMSLPDLFDTSSLHIACDCCKSLHVEKQDMRLVIPLKASIAFEKCIYTSMRNVWSLFPPLNSSFCLSDIKTGMYHAAIKSQQKMQCPLAIELILFSGGAMAEKR